MRERDNCSLHRLKVRSIALDRERCLLRSRGRVRSLDRLRSRVFERERAEPSHRYDATRYAPFHLAVRC